MRTGNKVFHTPPILHFPEEVSCPPARTIWELSHSWSADQKENKPLWQECQPAFLARPTCLCSTWAYWKQWLTYWTRFPVARRIPDNSWKDWVESGKMVCFKDSKQSAFKQKHVVRLAECVCQYWQCLVVWKCKSKNNCGNFWLVKPKQGLSSILYCRAS